MQRITQPTSRLFFLFAMCLPLRRAGSSRLVCVHTAQSAEFERSPQTLKTGQARMSVLAPLAAAPSSAECVVSPPAPDNPEPAQQPPPRDGDAPTSSPRRRRTSRGLEILAAGVEVPAKATATAVKHGCEVTAKTVKGGAEKGATTVKNGVASAQAVVAAVRLLQARSRRTPSPPNLPRGPG